MSYLITGANGQVGLSLTNLCCEKSISHQSFNSSDFDITNFCEAKKTAFSIKPSLIINTAAYTNVDGAETNESNSSAVNYVGVKNLTKICNDLSIPLIHISTDYVFDGKSSTPYKETDPTSPINIYGKTKLEGEKYIQEYCESFIIVRTSSIFSRYGNNFFKTILKLASTYNELKIISDQMVRPTYAMDLANALITISNFIINNKFKNNIFHYAGNQTCSWYEFASTILEVNNTFSSKKYSGSIIPIPSEKYVQAAKRPIFSALDSKLICDTFQIKPSNWMAAIPEILKKLEASN